MATLLIAEHDHASLKDSTNKALTAATQLGAEVHVLVAGGGGPTAEVWDPVADRWTATGPFTDQPDYGVRLAPLPDGTVLLIGMKVQLWSPH